MSSSSSHLAHAGVDPSMGTNPVGSLTAIEQRALDAIKKLMPLYEGLKLRNPGLSQAEISSIIRDMGKLVDDIGEMHKDPAKPKVKNIYCNQFLTIVDKYNEMFHDTRSNKAAAAKPSDLLKYLKTNLLLKPISHPLTGSSAYTKLSYEYFPSGSPDSPGFDEHIVLEREGIMRNFYDLDQASLDYRGRGKDFLEAYREDTLAIGGGTQSSRAGAFFTNISHAHTQGKSAYWHPVDKIKKGKEKQLFRLSLQWLSQGQGLTAEMIAVHESGNYHRSSGSSCVHTMKPYVLNQQPILNHRRHAGDTIDLGFAIVITDPIDKVGPGYAPHLVEGSLAKLYFGHIIWISHNHFDHLDLDLFVTAWLHLQPLIIVPGGVGRLLREKGFYNVVDMESWNAYVKVEVKDDAGNVKGRLTLYGLPVPHASNRSKNPTPKLMWDINITFFQGCMIHVEGSDHLITVKGDAGVQNPLHKKQYADFKLRKRLTNNLSDIPGGPDRPRKELSGTHASTGDLFEEKAEKDVTNVKVARQRDIDAGRQIKTDREYFLENRCKVHAYHEGCLMLGFLHYDDVKGTSTRMMAAVKFYGDITIQQALDELDKDRFVVTALGYAGGNNSHLLQNRRIDNFIYVEMDDFERKSIIATLEKYTQLQGVKLTDVLTAMSEDIYMMKPGETIDFNESPCPLGMGYDFKRLIVNCGAETSAYEVVLAGLGQDFIDLVNDSTDIDKDWKIVQQLFQSYDSRAKNNLVKNFLNNLESKKSDGKGIMHHLNVILGESKQWKTFDQIQRDEGQFATILWIAYGVLKENKFRAEFIADLINAHPQLSVRPL